MIRQPLETRPSKSFAMAVTLLKPPNACSIQAGPSSDKRRNWPRSVKACGSDTTIPRIASMQTWASTQPARDLNTWTTVKVKSKSKKTMGEKSRLPCLRLVALSCSSFFQPKSCCKLPNKFPVPSAVLDEAMGANGLSSYRSLLWTPGISWISLNDIILLLSAKIICCFWNSASSYNAWRDLWPPGTGWSIWATFRLDSACLAHFTSVQWLHSFSIPSPFHYSTIPIPESCHKSFSPTLWAFGCVSHDRPQAAAFLALSCLKAWWKFYFTALLTLLTLTCGSEMLQTDSWGTAGNICLPHKSLHAQNPRNCTIENRRSSTALSSPKSQAKGRLEHRQWSQIFHRITLWSHGKHDLTKWSGVQRDGDTHILYNLSFQAAGG